MTTPNFKRSSRLRFNFVGLSALSILILAACSSNPPLPTVAVIPSAIPQTNTVPVPSAQPITGSPTIDASGTPQSIPSVAPTVEGNATAVPPTVTEVPPTLPPTIELPSPSPQPTLATNELPAGTLILLQRNQPIAALPDGQTISLPDERFGKQVSPDGKYGVKLIPVGTLTDLALVDFTVIPNTVSEVPGAKGFYSPIVTWKPDSSGFAFYDFPPPDKVRLSRRTLYYYDLATQQVSTLVKDENSSDTVPSSIAFSPDSKSLIYTLNSGDSEGIGDVNSPVYLLDLSNGSTQALPSESAYGFNTWLPDSSGFVTSKQDQTGVSQVTLYRLNDLANPVNITPAGASDRSVDLSPDGKQLVIASASTDNPNAATIYTLNLDGSQRKQVAALDPTKESVTALFWGRDGIFYSVSGSTASSDVDVTWRIDTEGKNPQQLTSGTIQNVVGGR